MRAEGKPQISTRLCLSYTQFIISIGIQFMDHLRIMGFQVLLFTALFTIQFAEARILDDHFHKEATPGDGSTSKALAGIEKVAPIEGNADTHHMILNLDSSPGVGHMTVNILSSGQSPGVGHWVKSKTKTKYSTSPASSVLSSGPSPGAGNAHTSAVGGTQLQSSTFNKLPSGPSPGVGNKVINGYTEMAQGSESKKSEITNILSGPSPGVGNSATNGRNMMEKIRIEDGEGLMGTQSVSSTFNKLPSGPSPGVGNKVINGYTEIAQESESKKSEITNILSGPSPGVGNSATNGRNTMEKIISTERDGEGMSIKTFNRLPSGPSPGVGDSDTKVHVPENIKIASASENRKGSDHIPIFHKLPGGPSPGGGHSSTVRMKLSSTAPMEKSSSPSPGHDNSSMTKLKPGRGSQKKKVEKTAGALDRKIGCDASRTDRLSEQYSEFVEESDFYGTPTPPMFGTAAGRDSGIPKL